MRAFLSSFRRPFAMLRRHRLAVAGGVLMVAAFSTLKMAIAHLIGVTIDGLEHTETEAGRVLLVNTAWLGAMVVAEAVCRYFGRRWIIDASRHVEARLKRDLMRHMARLPVAWYDRSQTGDLLSRLTQDVELLRFLIGPTLLYGSQILVTIPIGVTLMWETSGSVTLAVLGAFAVLLVALLVLLPRMHAFSRRVQEDIGDISQHAQESFAGIRVLLEFACGAVFARRLDAFNQRYLADNMAMTRFRAVVHMAIHFCTDLVLLAVLVFGLVEVIEARMTLGDLVKFITIMGFLVWPLIAAGWILGLVHRARAAGDRVEEVFAAAPEPAGGLQPALRGDLEVRDLTFRYPGPDQPVALQNVSFRLRPGQKLGLVGAVGSGKSTLLQLLVRLYDPPRGTVLVDGHDVLDLDPACLRRLFAFAPQEPFLFSDTVADNIRFGGGDDTDRAVVTAAVRNSALEQDVESLADGLDTVVGERGVTLSGGQKQRVSLARALVADRPVVVLDDTLSAVDHQTEARILERLRGAGGDRSLLVASHRLSAVADADLILVLAGGRVRERGTHAELCRAGGEYARAYALQREARALGGED